jgi:DNA-binding beta-propeller fold protein YncE|tara:strand:- start:4042 stop:5820 length:1779 start_codon:yes stop_codon:yes gene_type:complete
MKKTLLLISSLITSMSFSQNLTITESGRYTDSREGACEISCYDKDSKKLFVTNAASDSIDIINVSNIHSPQKIGGINVLNYGGGVNSVVALNNGYIAAAIEATVKQDSGFVVFFDTAGTFISSVKVGALPDMITVTPDGNKVITANEGEPNDAYTIDPKGSISIIDISKGVSNVTQSDVTLLFFDNAPVNIPGSIKNPATNYNVDLEPEYVAINTNSTIAMVVCQESNVFIEVDLIGDSILSYLGLGFKDHSLPGNGIDASNKDIGINIQNWPVKGVFQPDAISSYEAFGRTYYLSANEGDGRDYSGFSSETRIKDLTLDSITFPNRDSIQNDTTLGRLKTFTENIIGDTDGDGDVDELYSYGARSFSIWDETGYLVWDSGDEIEQYMATNYPTFFNCNDGKDSKFDSRSDDKGPEPEAITTGRIGNRSYAFVGLERQGGILVYDITTPTHPFFDQYIQNMDTTTGEMIDIAPEGLIFVSSEKSHTGTNLLVSSNEVSGTVTIYELLDNLVSNEEISKSKISIYPNPTNGLITIENEDISSFNLFNSLGKMIKTGVLNGTTTLDLNNFENGLYIIQMIDNQGNATSKKVIKN